MKILQLISSYGFFGAENVVLELSRQLSSGSVDNTLGVFENTANPHIELHKKAKKNNLKTVVFKCRGRFDLMTLGAIRSYVRKNNINIIHAHGYKSNIYGFAAAKMCGTQIAATCHSWNSQDARTRFYYGLEKFILRWFGKVVAVSEDIGSELLKIMTDCRDISVIFNGIDTARFMAAEGAVREEFNIGKETKIVGVVARLSAEKGHSIFFEAAENVSRLLPDVKFMLVGDGRLRGELMALSEKKGLGEKVIFTGLRDDLPQIYAAMDIFVLPSLNEGLPMVLLEAMAARKPVIASRVGAVPKVVRTEEDGLLVEPGSSGVLADAIIRLLKDEKLARQMADNANRKVAEEFSSRVMCSKYMSIYEELLSGK